MAHRGLATLFLPLVLVGAPAGGEEALDLSPGRRVRITEGDALSWRILTGTVRMADASALSLHADSEWGDQEGLDRTIPRKRIRRLEVQVRPPNRAKGAATGLALGVLAGVAFMVVKAELNNGSTLCDSTRTCGPEVLIGAVLGGGLGTVVGAGQAQPEWREVSLPPRDPPPGALGPPAPDVSRRRR